MAVSASKKSHTCSHFEKKMHRVERKKTDAALKELRDTSDLMYHVYAFLGENDRGILSRVDRQFCESVKSSGMAIAGGKSKGFAVKHFTQTVGLIKWARAEGCPLDARTCACAARGGHLKVLKWLRKRGCPWDARTCDYAARGGHLKMLEWLRVRGCPWDASTCAYAARGGHLKVLEWLRAQGLITSRTTFTFYQDIARQACLRFNT